MTQDDVNRRFSREVETILRRAGWFEGRAVDISAYDQYAFRPHPAARKVLSEFAGLRIGETGAGIDFATSDVDFTWRDWTVPDFAGYPDLDAEVGSHLHHVAEACVGNLALLLDESERMYAAGPGPLFEIASSFDAALESLLLGKRVAPA